MSDYTIVDNALSGPDFLNIKNLMFDKRVFSWYYNDSVTTDYQSDLSSFYFTHMFYEEMHVNSSHFNVLKPILDILKPNALIRVKGNLYPNLGREIINEPHIDYDFEHKGALFYVNTNNGYTIMEDGTKIESIENRLVLFNSAKKHQSTHCTDQKVRVNINFNYF